MMRTDLCFRRITLSSSNGISLEEGSGIAVERHDAMFDPKGKKPQAIWKTENVSTLKTQIKSDLKHKQIT